MRNFLTVFIILVVAFGCSESVKETAKSTSKVEQVKSLVVTDTTILLDSDVISGSLHLPILTCAENKRSIDSLIYTHLSFNAITESNLDDVKTEFEASGFGLNTIDYQINFNKNGIFDISYDMTYVSASLNYSYINKSLDLFSAREIQLDDIITQDKKDDFLLACMAKFDLNVNEAREKIATDEDEMISEMFDGLEMEEEDLNDFSMHANKFVVYHDVYFPGYAKAYEPSSSIIFSEEEIMPFLNMDSDIVLRWLQTEPSV